MARKKTSTAEDLFDLVAMLPWWAGVVLAVVVYVFLHGIANSPATAPAQAGRLGPFVAQQLFKTLAIFGQYLIPFICLAGAAASAFRRAQCRKLFVDVAQSASVGALNGMSWRKFERPVGEAFRHRGFAVTETGGGCADGGVDLMLTKAGEKFLVQCKQWKALKVGVGVVRELYGVMAAKGAAGGYVVTSGQFTQEARDFASGLNISLMDGVALKSLIGGVIVPPVTEPACPKCGSAMVTRVAKQGVNAGNAFWGCTSYPACKGTWSI